jgi:hypothetical protein
LCPYHSSKSINSTSTLSIPQNIHSGNISKIHT